MTTVKLLRYYGECNELVQSGLSAMQDACMVQAICLAGDDTDVYHMPFHRLTSTVWTGSSVHYITGTRKPMKELLSV